MTELAQIAVALESPDSEERRVATARLGALPPSHIVDLLLRALGDEDWRVRKEAVGVAVAMAPDPVVLRGLVETFSPDEENIGLRNAAVEAVGGYGAAAVDSISMMVGALDADGKKLAAEALGRTGHAAALVVLRALEKEADPNVQAAVVEAMAAIGATYADQVAPALEVYLESDDVLLRLTALNGLNDMQIAVAWEKLEPMLGDPVMRQAALTAAGRSADLAAAPVLVDL